MNAAERYFENLEKLLSRIRETQREGLETAARRIAGAVRDGHLLYTFGTGHGHLLALEIFYRAGGLAPVCPMLDEKLMLHVSAAGSTLYELCACGVPTITYVLADNQIPAAVVFGDKGIMIDAGDVRKNPDFIRDLFDRIMDLAENKEKRIAMSQAMRTIVDGRGANRLATVISQLKEDNDVSI